jgi:hypothetical protein
MRVLQTCFSVKASSLVSSLVVSMGSSSVGIICLVGVMGSFIFLAFFPATFASIFCHNAGFGDLNLVGVGSSGSNGSSRTVGSRALGLRRLLVRSLTVNNTV